MESGYLTTITTRIDAAAYRSAIRPRLSPERAINGLMLRQRCDGVVANNDSAALNLGIRLHLARHAARCGVAC